jgi:hypothetical protein
MSERLATADPSLIADPVNEIGNHPRRAATTPVTTVQESKTEPRPEFVGLAGAHHMKNSEILPTSGLLIGDPCGWTVTGCWRPSPYRPRGFHMQRLLDEVCAS